MSEDLYTSGRIAAELGAKVWAVRHILNTRPIKPVGRVGITRVYGQSALESVRRELALQSRSEVAVASMRDPECP